MNVGEAIPTRENQETLVGLIVGASRYSTNETQAPPSPTI